jgi:hypothetical protein
VVRWTILEKAPGGGAMRRWLYLAAKALGVCPAKHCLVSLLQWAMTPFRGCEAPGLRYLV